MASSTALFIDKGASRTIDLTILNDQNQPFDLTGATITFIVKATASDLDPILIQKLSSNNTQILITNVLGGLAQVFLLPGDTSTLPEKNYVYKVFVDVGENEYIIIDWSIFQVKVDGAIFAAPVFTNTVKLDHNFGSADAFTYKTSGGSPIQDAQIRVYYKTDFDTGNLNAPIAFTLTDSFGHWISPVFVFPGFTYTLQFMKPNEFGPDTVEITV